MENNNTPTLLDEFDVASYTSLSGEEAKALLILTGRAYECNGISYVKTDEINYDNFTDSLKKEATAYVKRLKVLEFIEDNPGCLRVDIRNYMEDLGEKPSYDSLNLILTILTEEYVDLYEDEQDRLYVWGCDFVPTV